MSGSEFVLPRISGESKAESLSRVSEKDRRSMVVDAARKVLKGCQERLSCAELSANFCWIEIVLPGTAVATFRRPNIANVHILS